MLQDTLFRIQSKLWIKKKEFITLANVRWNQINCLWKSERFTFLFPWVNLVISLPSKILFKEKCDKRCNSINNFCEYISRRSGKVEFSMYKLHNFYMLNKSLLKWKLVVYTWEIVNYCCFEKRRRFRKEDIQTNFSSLRTDLTLKQKTSIIFTNWSRHFYANARRILRLIRKKVNIMIDLRQKIWKAFVFT